VTTPPDRCSCGSTSFRQVEVAREPGKPPYRTEFFACSGCGVMFHPPSKFRSLVLGRPDASP
jgi:hypothetical protein